ncbi:MAG: 2'-5' RNA ligase family protein [Chitinophagaceae bacterium]|nr:2'-5' RNA ligase family protein [Chitinophagaceae bacterium]
MKTGNIALPGYKINEYLIVLNPHEELRNKIKQVKKDFFETYKASTSINSRPHLSLVTFQQYELMEERIMNRLNLLAMGFAPFKVELKDFGSFPSHTIFINVTSKVPIQNLVKDIRTETQRLMKLNDENKPHFILEPHIPVARKLKPWQYEKGWLEYSNKHFTGRFIADSMLLLKRPVGEMGFQIAGRFQFQNLPVATKQGELFA